MHRPSFLRSKARLATATLTLVPGLVLGLASCSSEAAETGDPLFGGRAIVQVYGLSDSLNGAIDNSNTTLAIQYEIHETLLLKDWGTTQFVPNVAEAWHTEDLVVLKREAPAVSGETEVQVYRGLDDRTLDPRRVIYGTVTETLDGVSVSPASPGSDLAEGVSVPQSSIDRVERGCVFTFELREGIPWQPSLVYEGDDLEQTAGQTLDAHDVHFSWSIYSNDKVSCDAKRFRFEAIPGCRVVDDHTVRFFGAGQNALAFDGLGDSLTLLPSHIYNLLDTDCPEYAADATLAQQAEHININEHNRMWVGVGPYQVTAHDQQSIEARRFVDENGAPAYFDAAARPGYFDTIRWRSIANGEQALTALRNDEVDFVQRVGSTDYFGPRTNDETFLEEYQKGLIYLGDYSYVCWNLHSPKLKDLAVRKALAHAFDMESYLMDQNQGLGRIMTGPVYPASDGYPKDAEALKYDPELAVELLEGAGWYDHNGDGVADKDGVELVIDLIYPAGSNTFKVLTRALQDAARAVGIKVNVTSLEAATLIGRMKNREFDAISLAWFPALESDPEQVWHSKWGGKDVLGSSNNAGVMDDEVDRLVQLIQRETNRNDRMKLWKQFHRYVYDEVQPYLFCLNVPITYAASNKIHGIEPAAMTPGYVIREWHYTDPAVPGVRGSLRQ